MSSTRARSFPSILKVRMKWTPLGSSAFQLPCASDEKEQVAAGPTVTHTPTTGAPDCACTFPVTHVNPAGLDALHVPPVPGEATTTGEGVVRGVGAGSARAHAEATTSSAASRDGTTASANARLRTSTASPAPRPSATRARRG